MKAFITGGTGFIGSNIVAELNERGIEARVLKREGSSLEALKDLKYETVTGGILDPVEALAEMIEGCTWVFHVAAVADYWRVGHNQIIRVNVGGTKNMLDAAVMAKVSRFVYTSSLWAIGFAEDGQPVDESHTFNLPAKQYPYAYSKHISEQHVGAAIERGLEAVIVNPSVVLGERDINMISGSIIIEAAKGLAIVYPSGGVNYVYVKDVALGHIAAAERGDTGQRYILAGENIKHRDAIDIVCEIVGRPSPRIRLPDGILPAAAIGVSAARKIFGNRIPLDENQVRLMAKDIYADGRKAVEFLDLPQTPFETAVQNAYDWYNSNGYFD